MTTTSTQINDQKCHIVSHVSLYFAIISHCCKCPFLFNAVHINSIQFNCLRSLSQSEIILNTVCQNISANKSKYSSGGSRRLWLQVEFFQAMLLTFRPVAMVSPRSAFLATKIRQYPRGSKTSTMHGPKD